MFLNGKKKLKKIIKQWLFALLEENLAIEIADDYDYVSWDESYHNIKVTLFFDGEEISTSKVNVDRFKKEDA